MAIELFGLEFTGRRFRGQEALPAVPTAFRECSFLGCSVAPHSDRSELVTVEDVSLARCTVAGGGVWGVHLRDITVDTLAVRNLPRITNCVFEHVSLQGRIDQLLIQVGW